VGVFLRIQRLHSPRDLLRVSSSRPCSRACLLLVVVSCCVAFQLPTNTEHARRSNLGRIIACNPECHRVTLHTAESSLFDRRFFANFSLQLRLLIACTSRFPRRPHDSMRVHMLFLNLLTASFSTPCCRCLAVAKSDRECSLVHVDVARAWNVRLARPSLISPPVQLDRRVDRDRFESTRDQSRRVEIAPL
jgi:hypothetical protein